MKRDYRRSLATPHQLPAAPCTPQASPAFTLIELLVVMAIIGTLLAVAVPRYFKSIEKSKEAVLRQDLAVMREALDRYYGDRGQYPDTLADLVSQKYLRVIPPDPITGNTITWVPVEPPSDAGATGVRDVKSGAPGTGSDGLPYGEW